MGTAEDLGTVEEAPEADEPGTDGSEESTNLEEVVATTESEEGGESESQDEELELVREGTQPQFSQDDLTEKIIKAKAKVNRKHAKADEEADATRTALALAEERNKLLAMQLEQQQVDSAITAPNADEFDEGTNDPAFQEKARAYTQQQIDQSVAKKAAELARTAEDNAAHDAQLRANDLAQDAHYERVKKLKVPNYFEKEAAAVDIMGQEVVSTIIRSYPDDSQNLLWYLGHPKNKAEAERISGLLESNIVMGIDELGGLRRSLKVKPKSNTVAPDPDTQLKGDASLSVSKYDRQLDKFYDDVADGKKTMAELMAFTKRHDAATAR